MITDTEYSVKSAAAISRKEKAKASNAEFQDILSALTGALQMANPHIGNHASNGFVQNSVVKNTVQETPNKSRQNENDIARNKMDQNDPQGTDKLFANNFRDAQDKSKADNERSAKDRRDLQTSSKEQTKPASKGAAERQRKSDPDMKSGADNVASQKNEGDDNTTASDKAIDSDNSQANDIAESDTRKSETDLNQMVKLLTGQDLQDASNTQDGSQDIAARQQFLSLLNKQGDQIEDLLIKAGMSEADAENLIGKVESQIENSIQAFKALDTDASATSTKPISDQAMNFLAKEIIADSNGKVSLGETMKSQAENFGDELKVKLDEAEPEMKSRHEVADALRSIVDKAKEDSVQSISSSQSQDEISYRDWILQNQDSNIQGTLNNDNSESSAKFSESVKVASNTSAHNVTGDLSPKSTNEIRQTLTAQETVNRGQIEKPVINQIIEKFSLRVNGQQNEINIKLEPPDLGTVRVNIVSEGDHVKTTLIAETHAIKQAIENNLGQLRDSMTDQGLKVQSFTVLVGGDQGQKGQNQQQQQATGNLPGIVFPESSVRQDIVEPVMARRQGSVSKSQSISVFA